MSFKLRRVLSCTILLLAPLVLLPAAGCEVVGVIGQKVVQQMQVEAAYPGLKGQQVAIMVWADEGILMDHPRVDADVASSLKGKLQEGADAKVEELKNVTFFPVSKVLAYQQAHPESQSDPAEQVALQFPANRLIYIEIETLSLHPGETVDLWRGQITANVKVVEVDGGRAKVAFETKDVTGTYPDKSPPEGTPNLNDDQVYAKSIDSLTSEIGKLFVSHDQDEQ